LLFYTGEFGMAITPQLIKDQEFQVKFRGCDPLEVRDYLETIADEFFELQEQCKEYLEELETLRDAKESSDDYTGSLETDMEFTRKISDELKDSCTQKEQKLKDMTREVEELQLRIGDMEQEDTEHVEEVSAMEARIEESDAALKASETDKDILHNKIEVLLEQNRDLKKEEVDFKSTLATAQRFAEDLKEKSRLESKEMIAAANAEIKKIRDDAHAELERLPREIAALKEKKGEVKADLKATLASYLETIEVFYPDDDDDDVEQDIVDETAAETEENDDQESDDLFQTIEINDDGTLDPEDVEKLNTDTSSTREIDEEVLDSLLRGDNEAEGEAFDLKNMFSLEDKEEKESSS